MGLQLAPDTSNASPANVTPAARNAATQASLEQLILAALGPTASPLTLQSAVEDGAWPAPGSSTSSAVLAVALTYSGRTRAAGDAVLGIPTLPALGPYTFTLARMYPRLLGLQAAALPGPTGGLRRRGLAQAALAAGPANETAEVTTQLPLQAGGALAALGAAGVTSLELVGAGRAGVCGNGVCEVGEQLLAGPWVAEAGVNDQVSLRGPPLLPGGSFRVCASWAERGCLRGKPKPGAVPPCYAAAQQQLPCKAVLVAAWPW